MTTPFTKPSQDERVPPQWLVSAFMVLLGVAIIAAIPASAASGRGSVEAIKSAHGVAERIVVRAKIKIRLLPAQPSASNDVAQISNIAPPVAFSNDAIVPRIYDAGTRIAQRGIKIRAPPADVA